MSSMTTEQAREYLNRWALVKQVEVAELRSTSMDTKLQQLAVLMASSGLFRPSNHERARQADELRERWARIRKALGG